MSEEGPKPDVPASPSAEFTPPSPATTPAPTAAPPPIPAATGLAQPPSVTTPPPIVPSPATRSAGIIGRLAKIEIENYRAFRGRFELDLPEGCNLLVYGENGAGKSSLYNALNDFLENSERYTSTVEPNRHKYNTDPAVIQLGFIAASPTGDGTTITKFYECSASKNGANTSEIQTVNKGKGFLDYKSLLRVHLLPTGESDINLFDLFIEPLLAHYKNPVSNMTFGDEWQRIKKPFAPYLWQPYGLDKWFTDFNAGFERVVKDSVAVASEILSKHFDKEMAIEVDFKPAEYRWRPKRLTPPRIVLKLIFRRLSQERYHDFLNEARLSALAMAIFFSSLKLSPATGYRLLVLDDILIGLDMANRMLVLGILEKFFADWQIILLTYHKAWFEILKSRVDVGEWRHPWKSVSIRLGKAMGVACPVISESAQTLLTQARAHFAPEDSRMPDVKAAAVYARTAFEAVMSWFCEDHFLPVKYVQSRRELDTNDFLCSIEHRLGTIRNPKDQELARAVLKEIKLRAVSY
jgi:energy-coupling factor transporter ATP-binding protein EcfA2